MRTPRFLLSFFAVSALSLTAALAACTMAAPPPSGPAPTTPTPAPTPGENPPTPETPPTPPTAGGECVRTGCSGSVCAAAPSDVMTICDMRPEYECYASAKCERQANGACGFTQTPALSSCVANAKK